MKNILKKILQKSSLQSKQPVFQNSGYCVNCDQNVTFTAYETWFRDHYLCDNCGSIPRERALMLAIERFYPEWATLAIHESSPAGRGASLKLKQKCQQYVGSHFFPDFPLGETHNSGWKNENLEAQSFEDESFDLVITQDVMEHIFNPKRAFAEIERTLKPGGAHICTVPLVRKHDCSQVRAQLSKQGEIEYLFPAEYHGNPIDNKGSLVTMHWGYDVCEYIQQACGMQTTIVFIDDIYHGIRAEYIEVLVSRKSVK